MWRFGWLAAGNFPQHRTICEFRRRHLEDFERMFVEVVRVARADGGGAVWDAVGGWDEGCARMRASAGDELCRMLQEEARLKEEIEGLLERASRASAGRRASSRSSIISMRIVTFDAPCATTMPNSPQCPLSALISMVLWRTSSSRARCSIRTDCCSADFTAANRMVGRISASQIASASVASFLFVLTKGCTYCGGISRTACPSARSSRAQ